LRCPVIVLGPSAFVPHRPLPLARLPFSAPGGGRLAPQLRYTRINMILNWSVPAGALPVAVPGDCPRPFGLRPSPTAATRSAPFLRPRRRSPRSPTALHPDTWHYTTPEEKKQSKKLMLKKKWWGMQPTTSCSHTLYERVYKFFILLRAISANINAKTRR